MMFRSIRSRLILSQVIPLLVIIPIMGVALVKLIETRVLLPSLSRALMNNAVLLANLAGNDQELWSNPAYAEYYLTHLRQSISAQVMFLTPGGQLMASSDPSDTGLLGLVFDVEGVALARAGQVASYIYSNISSPSEVIDVFVPVINQSQQMVGILLILLERPRRNTPPLADQVRLISVGAYQPRCIIFLRPVYR